MENSESLKQKQETVAKFFLHHAEDNIAEVYGFLGDMAMELKEAIDHKQNRKDRLQILKTRLQQCVGALQVASLDVSLALDEENNGDKVKHLIANNEKEND